jgi:hypothetical protein
MLHVGGVAAAFRHPVGAKDVCALFARSAELALREAGDDAADERVLFGQGPPEAFGLDRAVLAENAGACPVGHQLSFVGVVRWEHQLDGTAAARPANPARVGEFAQRHSPVRVARLSGSRKRFPDRTLSTIGA